MRCKILHLLIADARVGFREGWLFLYLIVPAFLSSLVFLSDNPYTYLYLIIILLSLLIPQLPKLLYVLPLDNKTLRRYLHLRCLLTALLMLSTGGIFTLISRLDSIPRLEQGWQMISLFAQLCLMMGLYHTKTKKRHRALIYSLCCILILGNIVNFLLVPGFSLQMVISTGFLLASELLLFFCLRSFRLGNYTEPFYGYISLSKNPRPKKQEGGGQS
ncbi:hypothetical protein HNQ56_002200 [Anaerotaenia torta]|uniref:hypothetical protein n=1 Tax=Anaerotaenia torta TaxID=433293 RepID=UPI003D2336E7